MIASSQLRARTREGDSRNSISKKHCCQKTIAAHHAELIKTTRFDGPTPEIHPMSTTIDFTTLLTVFNFIPFGAIWLVSPAMSNATPNVFMPPHI
eukprot:1189426-Pyramimonas_sp.AAC.1